MLERPIHPVDERILEFIREHHVLTLATAKDNIPWVANCFYYYHEDWNAFIFTSEVSTRHMAEGIRNIEVAASIVLETSMVGLIQGLQISAKLIFLNDAMIKEAKKVYIKAFPVARLAELHLWAIQPYHIKMTHNRLGFGKKLLWNENG